MKFSNFLAFASLAFAAPAPVAVEPRDATVVGTVVDAVNTLEEATKANIAEIKDAVQAVKDNVEAVVEVEIIAIIKANYEEITKALKESTTTIAEVTIDAAGGIAEGVQDLTQEQVDLVVDAVKTVDGIVNEVEVVLEVTITDLTPAIKQAVAAEIDALKNVLSPFVKPVLELAEAVKDIAVEVGLTVTGLENALSEIGGLLNRVVEVLGIPDLL